MYAQDIVDITETTLKIDGLNEEEVLYFGFAEGDQLIFNFEEVKGKELKEVEIIELPSTSRFMDYKTRLIQNKIITIPQTSIYKFRFQNSSIGSRVCKIRIQRIPSSEVTRNFNSSVYWKTVYDTSYRIQQERYLISADTSIVEVTDQVAKVNSTTHINGNKTTLSFTLPPNTVSWSYYIGVDSAGQKAFESAATELSNNPVANEIANSNPMAALALNFIPYFSKLHSGEDIDYYFVQGENVNLFRENLPFRYFKNGKVINDYSRMTFPLGGMISLCLVNDNLAMGVSVTIKVTAVTVKENWSTRPIEKIHISSKEIPYLN